MAPQWLMKSEPSVYSIDDLERDGRTHWDGVRNYQARNLMRDQMQKGDKVLFYHSNAAPPGVVGIAEVVREGYPDFTAWDKQSHYYDPKSTEDSPRWFMVDVAFVEKLKRIVSLQEIKAEPRLSSMLLVKRSRLSVQPVQADEYEVILEMSRQGCP
jgi:predicted RNA-binding protein with PUA-like domain